MTHRLLQNCPTLKPDRGISAYFWGVRGSFCACGSEFSEFGGNTPCIEIRLGKRLFIIDAGSGFPSFSCHLEEVESPLNVDVLLSHLHMDHISGLMMAKELLLNQRCTIRTYCGNLKGESAEEALNTFFSPPFFPITMDRVPVHFEHIGFKAGTPLVFEDGISIRTIPLPHPGGATGYRFDHEGRSICYLSDLEHCSAWPPKNLTNFAQNADLIIFDGMFCCDDYRSHEGWGHSTWSKGIELCRASGAKALAIFHLNPYYDDAQMLKIEETMQREMPEAFIAREKHFIHLPPVF